MEVNQRRIFFSGVIAGMLVSIVVFFIYTNISTQRKLRLPNSADNIRYITDRRGQLRRDVFQEHH